MKWVALAWLVAAGLVREPAPLVRTSSGLIRGRLSQNGRFYEYFGIPYGTVNETNRFQAPLPAPEWDGIFDAQDENTWCPQPSFISSIIVGEADCLKLNIYTPVHNPAELLPVMVFIHGGCFFGGMGSPFLYGGDYFAEHDVVFVGINYRLSVEGFLCLGIEEAPGNAGLKDQIAALKWIRDNIHAFGGNKNDVTLFGESAGAVSTSFMILSPAARGLFHKAILQSGSSLAPWGLQHDPIKTASNLVKKFGYDTADPHEIHRILSNKTVRELISTLKNHEEKFCVADEYIFVPCVERKIEGVEPVVTEYPAEIIKSGNYTKMPMIIGHTDEEGIYFTAADYGTSLRNETNEINVLKSLRSDLEFPSELEKNCTVDKIKQFYFSSPDESIMDMVNLYSDLYFKFPLLLEADMFSKTSDQPMYYYLFRYSGYVNLPKIVSGFGSRRGASHADELFYLFKPRSIPLPLMYLEDRMIERMVMLWTNFAKYGNPTPKPTSLLPFRWRPSRESNPRALVLDAKPSTAQLWDARSVAFWNETYTRYRRREYGFKPTHITTTAKSKKENLRVKKCDASF